MIDTETIESLARGMERLQQGQRAVAHTMALVAKAHDVTDEPLRAFDPLAMGEIVADNAPANSVAANVTPQVVLFTHRLVCFELPSRLIGRFRREQVYLQKATSTLSDPTVTPPAPAEVPVLIEKLCREFRDEAKSLVTRDEKLQAMAKFFHGFLYVHPFTDGNGRVARSLLMQQCVEFFGRADMSLLDRGVAYYEALQASDAGNFEPLKDLISRVVGE